MAFRKIVLLCALCLCCVVESALATTEEEEALRGAWVLSSASLKYVKHSGILETLEARNEYIITGFCLFGQNNLIFAHRGIKPVDGVKAVRGRYYAGSLYRVKEAALVTTPMHEGIHSFVFRRKNDKLVLDKNPHLVFEKKKLSKDPVAVVFSGKNYTGTAQKIYEYGEGPVPAPIKIEQARSLTVRPGYTLTSCFVNNPAKNTFSCLNISALDMPDYWETSGIWETPDGLNVSGNTETIFLPWPVDLLNPYAKYGNADAPWLSRIKKLSGTMPPNPPGPAPAPE